MGKSQQMVNQPPEFVGVADQISEYAIRISEGEAGYVREPMGALIERCLLANQEIILQDAMFHDDVVPDEMDLVEEIIEQTSSNIIRPNPRTGREHRVTLMALPLIIHSLADEQLALPEALADATPIRDRLIEYGAPPQWLVVSPILYPTNYRLLLGFCETYRILHGMAPQELVGADPIVDADVSLSELWPKAISLPVAPVDNVRVILSAWVMTDDDWPPYLEQDLAAQADPLGEFGDLSRQLGCRVEALVPLPFRELAHKYVPD